MGSCIKRNKHLLYPLVILVIIVSVVLIVNSVKKIETGEVAIRYNPHTRTLGDNPQTAGLYSGAPGFSFIKFPSVFKTLKFDKQTCLNKQGLEVIINYQFQHRAMPKHLRKIILRYRNYDTFVRLLRSLALSALRDSCSAFNTTQFQTQRSIFQEHVRKLTADSFHNVSAELKDLQISNIVRPASYESAVRAMEKAKENIKLALTQRPRNLIAADTKKQETVTAAQITKEKGRTDAKVIIAQAEAQAAAITAAYEAEADAYAQVMRDQNLDIDGLLSYLAVRVVAEKKNVGVSLKEPARTKYTHT